MAKLSLNGGKLRLIAGFSGSKGSRAPSVGQRFLKSLIALRINQGQIEPRGSEVRIERRCFFKRGRGSRRSGWICGLGQGDETASVKIERVFRIELHGAVKMLFGVVQIVFLQQQKTEALLGFRQ